MRNILAYARDGIPVQAATKGQKLRLRSLCSPDREEQSAIAPARVTGCASASTRVPIVQPSLSHSGHCSNYRLGQAQHKTMLGLVVAIASARSTHATGRRQTKLVLSACLLTFMNEPNGQQKTHAESDRERESERESSGALCSPAS